MGSSDNYTRDNYNKYILRKSADEVKAAENDYLAALRSGDEEKKNQAKLAVQKARDIDRSLKDANGKPGREGDLAKVYDEMSNNYKAEGEADVSDLDKRAEEDAKNAPEDNPDNAKSSYYVPRSFYDNVAAGLYGRPQGNQYDVRTNTYKNLAEQKGHEAAREDKEAQWHNQQASESPYARAGEKQSFGDDAMDRNFVRDANIEGRKRVRRVAQADPNQEYQYNANQFQQGEGRADAADTDREGAIEAHGASKEQNIQSRDFDWDRDWSYRLSMGQGAKPDAQKKPEDKPDEEQPPKPQPQEQTPPTAASAQAVINHVIFNNDSGNTVGSNTGKPSQWYNNAGMTDDVNKLYQYWGAPEPLTPEEVAQVGGYNASLGKLTDLVAKKYPAFFEKYKAAEAERKIGTSEQLNLGNKGMTREKIDSMQGEVPGQTDNTQSDYRVKNISRDFSNEPATLSDFRMKLIKYDLDNGNDLESWALPFLKYKAGKYNHNGRDYDIDNDDDWTDEDAQDVLSGYAQHIRNFVYTYKPEAKGIDPSIDPNEEHIGPMAQDIEKVNPACIKETKEGVKTVDTSRLALMNAGAIGDLARQMEEFATQLKALEEQR